MLDSMNKNEMVSDKEHLKRLMRESFSLGDFISTKAYANMVLDIDARCAEAYLVLEMAREGVKSVKELAEIQANRVLSLKYASEFGADSDLVRTYNDAYNTYIKTRDEAIQEKLISEEQRNRLLGESKATLEPIRAKIAPFQKMVFACDDVTIGLKTDGTIIFAGEDSRHTLDGADKWKDIVDISMGDFHTVALKSDGTVVAVGDNSAGQCNVKNWKDIVAICAGSLHTVGLKKDGTVVATEYKGDLRYNHGQYCVQDWKDIVAISASGCQTIGLKRDGTVVATNYVGTGHYIYHGQCNVDHWSEIVAISSSPDYTLGLRRDGTVVATKYFGEDYTGWCDVQNWRDIVAISAGYTYSAGLKKDGTVVYTRKSDDTNDNNRDAQEWKDIVAISAKTHLVGLKSDGTVVAVGKDYGHSCDVQDFKLFDNFESEQKERVLRAERISRGVCSYCGGALKGTFTKKCESCGQKKDY